MAPTPFRRGKKSAKAVRNLAIAEAALALAKHRAMAAAPGRKPKRSRGKLMLLGGVVAAAGAAALLKRDKVAGLLPSRSGEPEPAAPPPQQSNYDAPGPVANTATPVPAPDPQVPEAVDEAAEEAAAAAEAGAIGGTSTDYAGPECEPASAAERPLAEAGEGESEGEEQAEAELAANAEYRDSAPSDAERQIDETIEEASQPTSGETPEPIVSEQQESFLPPEPPAAEDEEPKAGEEEPGKDEPGKDEPRDDDPGDWRTWSGRSVQP
jgi:hypothetical protein